MSRVSDAVAALAAQQLQQNRVREVELRDLRVLHDAANRLIAVGWTPAEIREAITEFFEP